MKDALKEAMYYVPSGEKNGKPVLCVLCPNRCKIAENKTGRCGIRASNSGKLYALVYDKYTSINLDPIEKKPLYHFCPGRSILSIGTAGCNLKCRFCQNYDISQAGPFDVPSRRMSSSELVKLASEGGSIGLAYTYNEPMINFEHLIETSMAVKKKGLVNVYVTNGYVCKEPLRELMPFIDAANVDVKSFENSFYKKYCDGALKPVLETVETLMENGRHVEITNLLIPGLNDGEKNIEKLAEWIFSISDEIPLHFSGYHPCYRMSIEPTPFSTLENAKKIASGKLKHVYLGNVWEKTGSNTVCPACGVTVIKRHGYETEVIAVKGSKCSNCGAQLNIHGT